jgi:hypothetical protein
VQPSLLLFPGTDEVREAQIKRVEVDIGSLGDGDYRFRTSQRWDVSGLETRLVGIVIKKWGR